MMNYKEVKVLGKGSFGRAILVKEISTGKEYVMKIINTSQMKPKERQEALQEAQLLKNIKSPYVTKYHASFTDANNLYIVMEYCNAGDMYQLIKSYKNKNKYIKEDDIWHLVVQLLLGLKHLHDRKLLHRDIKSQNTLLYAADQSVLKDPYQNISKLTVKLADLGCSKILQATNQLAATQVASPYYMSPEIAQNIPYSSKSDIWSLGVTIYELCTLQHAFEATSLKSLVIRILSGQYKPIPSTYSTDLQQLIKLCLQKDQKLRPNINQLVNMPAVQKHIKQVIPKDVIQDELSHTMLHQGNFMQGFEYDKHKKEHQYGIKNDQVEEQQNQNQNAFGAPGVQTLAKKYDELEAYAQQVGISGVNQSQQSQQQQQQQKINYQFQQQQQSAQVQQQQKIQQPPQRPIAQNRLNGQGPARLAPMNEKERIKWLKEKEQAERRQKIIDQQKEHQRKLEEQQKARQQKYDQINKKYEEQMAKRRKESIQAENKELQIQQQKLVQKQAQLEQQKKDKLQQELEMQQRQIAIKEKAEKERQQLQKLIEQRKQQMKNKPDNGEIQILENPNQKIKIQYEAKSKSEKIQQTLQAPPKDIQEPIQQTLAPNKETSDFEDEPQIAIANVNQKGDDKTKLLQDNTRSLPYRIEALHYNLEKELTFDTFFSTYKMIQKSVDNDEDVSNEQLKTVLREDQLGYINAIVQLLLAEQQVNEQQI